MATLIQLTDENNDPINSLNLGELTDNTTFKLRVWNNRTNEPGVEALSGLTLNLAYPPKPAVTTMAINDVFKVRCTFSGEFAEEIDEPFSTFPIQSEEYNRLDSGAYTEYEIQIDFSSLSAEQKSEVSDILSEIAIFPRWQETFDGRKRPKEREVTSDTSVWAEYELTISSDTEIVLGQTILQISSDSRVLVLDNELSSLSDSRVLEEGVESTVTSDSTIG